MQPLDHLAGCPIPLFNTHTAVQELLDTAYLPPMDAPPAGTPVAFPISNLAPLEDLAELRTRPIPSSLVLTYTLEDLRLCAGSGRALLDVRYDPPIPTPVWMLRYWLRLSSAAHGRRVWANARDALLERQANLVSHPGQELNDVTLALSSLAAIPWHYSLCDNPPIHSRDLLALLSPEPLPVSTVGMLVHILRREMQTEHAALNATIYIHGLPVQDHLTRAIPFLHVPDHPQLVVIHLMAAPLIGNPPRYRQAYFPWLSRGSFRLYVLDTVARVIRHGAMDGSPPVEEDVVLLRRWLEFTSNSEWTVGEGSIAFGGPEDGMSCGIAMVNAIRHHELGEPLWSPARRDACRLREYARVVEFMGSQDSL